MTVTPGISATRAPSDICLSFGDPEGTALLYELLSASPAHTDPRGDPGVADTFHPVPMLCYKSLFVSGSA